MTAPLVTPFNWKPIGPNKIISGRQSYQPAPGIYALVNAECHEGSSVVLEKRESGQIVRNIWLRSEVSSLRIKQNVERIDNGNFSRTSYVVGANKYFEGFIYNTSSNYHLHFHFDTVNETVLNNTDRYNFIIRGTNSNSAGNDEIREDASRVSLKIASGQEIFLLSSANTSSNNIHQAHANEMGIIGVEQPLDGLQVSTGRTFIDQNTRIVGGNYEGVTGESERWSANIVEYHVQS